MKTEYSTTKEMIWNSVLPQALAIGVDYELFWKLTPKSLQLFVSAFKFKREFDDHSAWLQGRYIRQAISSAFIKSAKYPDKPYSSQSSANTPEKIKAKMMMRMKELNARMVINSAE